MRIRTFFTCCSLALLGLSTATSAAPTTPAAASKQPYEFCVSGAAANGRVYISPVFSVALHDVRDEFTKYLAAAYDYRGSPIRCYSLTPESEAESFRTQIIEILHWRNQHDILAVDWTPGVGVPVTPLPQATRLPESASAQ